MMLSSAAMTRLAVVPLIAALRLLYRRIYHQRCNASEDSSPTTLDPTNWDDMRANAHALLDAAIDKMKSANEGRVWNPVPDEFKSMLNVPIPTSGISHDELRGRLQSLLPYGSGNTHPRFFGWVQGSGCPGGVLAEMVGSAMNVNAGGRDHAAIYVERQVLSWCREMLGFPPEAGGLLVSGTSLATILALKTARDRALGFAASRKYGLCSANGHGALVGYAAEGTHSCVTRAFDVLGLGSDSLRMVPVTDQYMMDVTKLAAMIEEDRRAGRRPFVLVGTAGSVNVGAVDDLNALADLATAQKLWFHVDGAFGAVAVLSPEAKPLLAGLERASSVAFDFHKWLHVGYEAGCILIRDPREHLEAFHERPDYLSPKTRGLGAGDWWPCDYGIELSRGFRALKVWAHFLEHGTQKLGAAISANLAQAKYLAELVDASPELSRVAPVTLQIVCFRYVPPNTALSLEALASLNDEIVLELQEQGIAAPSTTKIQGHTAIRVNLTNHRTRTEDIRLLVDATVRIGRELSAKSSR